MGSNIIELAKLGHEHAAELKASCGAVDVRSLAQLISDLATQLEVQFVRSTNMAVHLANAESKCREMAGVVAENADLKSLIEQHAGSIAVCPNCSHEEPSETDDIVALYRSLKTPATDRIVAGIKADGVAEREKTITFTAAKKRMQDGVALIAIGKPYKIHNDDVIGEFFIGERGRYGVITMDRLNYFTTSDEYAWEFSLREGADK